MSIIQIIALILISAVYKKIYSKIHVRIDQHFYYDIYLMKVSKQVYVNWFYNLLFYKHDWFSNKDAVPIYRVFQFLIACAVITPYCYFGYCLKIPLWTAADIILSVFWAVYWLKFDWGFYSRRDIFFSLTDIINRKLNPFWLKHGFQAGNWLFKDEFTLAKFEMSNTVGTIGYYAITIIVFVIYFITK